MADISARRPVHLDVYLTMHEYEVLVLMSAYAYAQASDDLRLKWKFIHITNRLLTGLPEFRPYEIPPEYRWEDD